MGQQLRKQLAAAAAVMRLFEREALQNRLYFLYDSKNVSVSSLIVKILKSSKKEKFSRKQGALAHMLRVDTLSTFFSPQSSEINAVSGEIFSQRARAE